MDENGTAEIYAAPSSTTTGASLPQKRFEIKRIAATEKKRLSAPAATLATGKPASLAPRRTFA